MYVPDAPPPPPPPQQGLHREIVQAPPVPLPPSQETNLDSLTLKEHFIRPIRVVDYVPAAAPPPQIHGLRSESFPIPPVTQPPSRKTILDGLTLKEHFIQYQQKRGHPKDVGEDMMTTWRIVGHNETTLRNMCRQERPRNQTELKRLLMRELDGISKVPDSHSIADVIDQTAEYFFPTMHADPRLIKIRSSATEPELPTSELKRKHPDQPRSTPSDPHGHPGSEERFPSPPKLYPMAGGHQPILGTSHLIGAPLPAIDTAQPLSASYPPMMGIHDQSPHMVPGLQQPMAPSRFHQMPDDQEVAKRCTEKNMVPENRMGEATMTFPILEALQFR
jgi:hypothetical protein